MISVAYLIAIHGVFFLLQFLSKALGASRAGCCGWISQMQALHSLISEESEKQHDEKVGHSPFRLHTTYIIWIPGRAHAKFVHTFL